MKPSFRRVLLPFALVGASAFLGAIAILGVRASRSSRWVDAAKRAKAAREHRKRLAAQDVALVAGLQGELRRVPLTPSKLLSGRSLVAWIYLPPGYKQSSARYPVAYVLHGNPGGVRDSFVNAGVHRVAEQLILSHQIAPMILVGFEGSGPRGFNDPVFYLDRRDGKYQMESWILRELVPFVDDHFRTLARPEGRALLGFSAGGFGAANLGLKHPNVFRVMASHAGFFDPDDDPSVMRGILGPRAKRWDDNSPLRLARQLPQGQRIHFYMDCGQNDPLLPEFEKMEAELRARNADFEAHVFEGAHDWRFLHAHYFDSLRFCDARFREMGAAKLDSEETPSAHLPQ